MLLRQWRAKMSATNGERRQGLPAPLELRWIDEQGRIRPEPEPLPEVGCET
jgi:hypothetical protein